MNKYGVEHFHIELLEETDKPEERERFWIEATGSFKFGYNATLGGDGRKYLDYDLIINTYKELQNITKTAKLLNICPESVTTALNSKHIKIISSQEVNKKQNGKAVKMLDKNNQYVASFESLADAAKYVIENHLSTSKELRGIKVHIRDCANGKRKTAYQYTWCWEL